MHCYKVRTTPEKIIFTTEDTEGTEASLVTAVEGANQ